MATFKLTLAYDGTDFAGWQVQPGKRSVQGVLETALRQITGEEVRAVASGRTDAGVHALGQVVAIRTDTRLPEDVLQRALNAQLPHDVAVLQVVRVPDHFHPIRDALRKRYRYVIHDGPVRDVFRRRFAWQYPCRLDEAAMHRAAQHLLGTHDMASFQARGAERETTRRTVYDIGVRRGQDEEQHVLTIEVEANGFLYKMVRAIVGTLVEVGRGAQDEAWVATVRDACDRRAAGPTAPAQGLCLVRVEYA